MEPALNQEPLEMSVEQARELLRCAEAGDAGGMRHILDAVMAARESGLFVEVGKLTREVHDNLVSFVNDENLGRLTESDIPDARQRLNYVIEKTSDAAHRTLTAIEAALPLVDGLEDGVAALHKHGAADAGAVAGFLALVGKNAAAIRESLNEMLMAQEYQDLTGQVIGRVIELVQQVETSLVGLIRVAHGNAAPKVAPAGAAGTGVEGPQINATRDAGVVESQDDVDELLASMGF